MPLASVGSICAVPWSACNRRCASFAHRCRLGCRAGQRDSSTGWLCCRMLDAGSAKGRGVQYGLADGDGSKGRAIRGDRCCICPAGWHPQQHCGHQAGHPDFTPAMDSTLIQHDQYLRVRRPVQLYHHTCLPRPPLQPAFNAQRSNVSKILAASVQCPSCTLACASIRYRCTQSAMCPMCGAGAAREMSGSCSSWCYCYTLLAPLQGS
jgi:hypothetical protein